MSFSVDEVCDGVTTTKVYESIDDVPFVIRKEARSLQNSHMLHPTWYIPLIATHYKKNGVYINVVKD